MSRRIISARHSAVQVVIAIVYMTSGTERTPVMVTMPCVTVIPIPVSRPAMMNVPPTRPISPIPRTMPCVPCRTPEPIVYQRTVNINRFDDVIDAIYVFIADHLYGHVVTLVFLHVYRGYVLVYILCEDCLQNDQTLVAFSCLYYAQVIYFTVSIQVEVAERAIRVVEHRLELLKVLSLCKKLSYNLQVQTFGDVGTVGRNRYCLVCPCHHAHQHECHPKCS